MSKNKSLFSPEGTFKRLNPLEAETYRKSVIPAERVQELAKQIELIPVKETQEAAWGALFANNEELVETLIKEKG